MAIKELNEKESKNEEINWLEEIAKSVQGKDLYVADLFTERFVSWVSIQIHNDFPPDVMAEMEHARDGETAANDSLRLAGKEIEARDLDLVKKSERIIALENRIGELDGEIRKGLDRITEVYEVAAGLSNANEDLKSEVTRLKVKLFDLMDK
jgi:hypothetical protein